MFKKDFMLTWDWEHDTDFIRKFEELCEKEGLSAIFVSPFNLNEVLEQLKNRKPNIKVLLDRASDTDAAFDTLIDKIILSGTKTLNEARYAVKAMDKATMHLEFLVRGIDVPYTLIISSRDDLDNLKRGELDKIGIPFIVKPAYGGGGEGVREEWSLVDIKKFYEGRGGVDKYLLQEKVVPVYLDGKRAYFRIFYVCGYIIPCWWDDQTHIYGDILTREEERKYNLGRLRDILKTIGEVSKLDFFSTEICITDKQHFVVVDYVNDPCDMRPRSKCMDGVPDTVVEQIIKYIIRFIKGSKVEELTPLHKMFVMKRRGFELKLLRRYR